MEYKIAVLLAVYNGEAFLAEQLESLFLQSYKGFVVYIHDDGSTDNTKSIIAQYSQKYPDRVVIMNDPVKHRGAGPSFMWMLEKVEAKYYMFCDQDDYWLYTKVEHTLNRMHEVERLNPGKPVLIHTDLKITDAYLNVIHSSFWKYHNFKVDVSKRPQFIAFGNIVTGCTMIINQAAKQLADQYDGKMLHDYWLALQVAKYGIIDNLKEQTILYRQHGNNEAGAGHQYNKHHIGYKHFLEGLGDEYSRFHDTNQKSRLAWLYYRMVYFIYRHFL